MIDLEGSGRVILQSFEDFQSFILFPGHPIGVTHLVEHIIIVGVLLIQIIQNLDSSSSHAVIHQCYGILQSGSG